MDINYKLVILATIVEFVLGGIWYSPLMFGKWWAQIMEMSHMTKDEMQKMQKAMAPFYAVQIVLAFITTVSFAGLLPYLSMFSVYHVGFWLWLGFIAPIQIGSVIWANTKKKYWVKQIFVMLSYQFVAIMVAGWILTM